MQIEFDPNTYLTDVLEKLKQNKQLNNFNKDLVALVVNDLFHKYFPCYETIRNVKQLKDLDVAVEKDFNSLFNIKNDNYDIEKLKGVGKAFDIPSAPYIPPINIPPYRKTYPYPNIIYNSDSFSEQNPLMIRLG